MYDISACTCLKQVHVLLKISTGKCMRQVHVRTRTCYLLRFDASTYTLIVLAVAEAQAAASHSKV